MSNPIINVDNRLFLHYGGINPKTNSSIMKFEFKNRKLSKIFDALLSKSQKNSGDDLKRIVGQAMINLYKKINENADSDVRKWDQEDFIKTVDENSGELMTLLLEYTRSLIAQNNKQLNRLSKQLSKSDDKGDYYLLNDLVSYVALQMLESTNLIDGEFMKENSIIQKAQFEFREKMKR